MENWKDIKGYEGIYQISTYGNVKSLNYNHTGKEKLLTPIVDVYDYLHVNLYKDGKMKSKKVHQLVAIAFIPNPLGLPQVNHKDENKENNLVENLEWCTKEYNNAYGTKNKRIAEALTNGKASKPVYQYSLDGTLVRIWPSTAECGRNGFNQGAVSDCCRGGRKTYKGFKWSYEKL